MAQPDEDAVGDVDPSHDSGETEAQAETAAQPAAEDDPPAIHQVEVDAYAILGTSSMPVSQLLRMGRGAVVELDRNVGDMVELRINNVLVARGEIVVVDDRIAVEITEIISKST